jgi:F-type H+-transporting ATPase subunit a
MLSRYLPAVFVALAVLLAVVAVLVSGFEPYHEHPHNPFGHVGDISDPTEHGPRYFWHFFESRDVTIPLGWTVQHGVFEAGVSKFILLETGVAIVLLLIFVPLSRRLATGEPARGGWDNAFEAVLIFLRDDVARPNIGGHDADRFVPFLWTLFFFILFNNLFGLLPWMGSPTANLYVTGALAVVAFVMMHGAAMVKMGAGHYFASLWPHVEVVPNPWRGPGGGHGHDGPADAAPAAPPTTAQVLTWVAGLSFGLVLSLMIFVIELLGTVIKSGVLAVRLFANMFAGHTVLAMILSFIIMAGNAAPLLWGGITVASVLGVVALSLLELFVAFLQSYIFVFLTALFMGMALHPSH